MLNKYDSLTALTLKETLFCYFSVYKFCYVAEKAYFRMDKDSIRKNDIPDEKINIM